MDLHVCHFYSSYNVNLFHVLSSYINQSSRWFGVPGHASPAATAHQEPQQWDSSPPEDQHHSTLGARGPLHPVLLHALPTDGMGEPKCWTLQNHLTYWEVSPTADLEMMLLSHFCFSQYPGTGCLKVDTINFVILHVKFDICISH